MILRAIAILLLAAPFAFGGLRLLTSGDDARYLWTALASTLGAAVLLVRPRSQVALTAAGTIAAVVLAFACAALAAFLLGATSGTAVAVVAAAFGACSASGLSLLLRSRLSRPP